MSHANEFSYTVPEPEPEPRTDQQLKDLEGKFAHLEQADAHALIDQAICVIVAVGGLTRPS
ncbi:hypothetical protein ABZ359_36895 [Streptomyces sp. NPDC005968]|uniref:hypothetical protein n=1 Tax=Streptomyces sp. NPDC005968 TaxID=3154574 RepID=UPI0033C869E8